MRKSAKKKNGIFLIIRSSKIVILDKQTHQRGTRSEDTSSLIYIYISVYLHPKFRYSGFSIYTSMFYVLNILCLISQSLYILTPCVFAGMKKKGEERKTGCFSVPAFSLRPSISCSVRSWSLCCLCCTAKKQPAEPAIQTLADSLYPAPVLIAICLDPATNSHSHFSCRRKVFHTHPADYRRIRIIEPHLGGGSHRLKRNACLIEPRCKTSKIPNLIGFRITASALLVISS